MESDGTNMTVEFFESDDHQLTRVQYLSATVVLFFIGLIGTSLNFIVILVVIKDAQTLWTPVNVMLLNLVMSDFLMAVLGSPIATFSAAAGRWYWGQRLCVWYAFLVATLGYSSIGNLTMMAVERYFLVTRPTKTMTIRQSMLLALCVWIYAFSLSSPPLLGWGSYGPEAGNVSCSVSWENRDVETGSESYIAFIFTFGLFLPVLLIGYSYLIIVVTVKKVGQRSGSRGRREAKVTKMIALMIAAFLLAWTPYAILALAAQYFGVKPSAMTAVLPAILAKSSSCYNPLIYVGLNAQFRDAIRKLFRIRESRHRTVEDSSGITVMNRIITTIESENL